MPTMAMIDNRIYVGGRPTAAPANLDETFELLREREGMAWIGLYRPGEAEIHSVAAEFSLHPLAVEDALKGHQRAKLERYGDTLFVVLRPAWYLDAEESVEFGEVHLFIGPEFVVTIRHATNPDLAKVRRRMEDNPDLLAHHAAEQVLLDACSPAVRSRCSTASSTRWWTATVRWSPVWRTTSTRSRTSSSAGTRPSPAGSTSCSVR